MTLAFFIKNSYFCKSKGDEPLSLSNLSSIQSTNHLAIQPMKRQIFLFVLALLSLTVSAQTKTIQRQSKPGQQTPAKPTPKQSKTATKSPTKPVGKPAPKQSKRKATPDSERQGEGSSPISDINLIIDNLVNNMVYVEGGTFTMGATSEQGSDVDGWEKPVHQVMLSSFSIGRYEVTQEEWEAVMGSNPSNFKGAKCPVEMVSRDDCQEFIRRLNELTGKTFRLPTEAEWEFAARGGNSSRGYKYAGGNDIDMVAWYVGNCDRRPHDVGTKQPNELGLYDMSGNVYEWCSDWFGGYSSSPQTNPKGPDSGQFCVLRGGGWHNNAWSCRVSRRGLVLPTGPSNDFGLRLAF